MRTSSLSVLALLVGLTSPLAAQDLFIQGVSRAQCCVANVSPTSATGQTFSVVDPSFSTLQSFSFWQSTAGEAQDFQAYLYEWDTGAQRPTGPGLYLSGITSPFSGVTDFAGAEHVFNVGGVSLDPARTYVAFLGAFGVAPSGGVTDFVHFVDDPYAGGSMVWDQDGDPSLQDALTTSWSSTGAWDMKFAADFGPSQTVVPEPSTVVLLGTGLLGVGLGIRGRRRHDEEDERA